MPQSTTVFGVPQVTIGSADPLGGTLGAITSLTTALSAVSAPVVKRGSKRSALSAGSYYAWMTLMGYDPVYGGYAMTSSTATPGSPQAITAGQGLLFRVTKTNWSAVTNFSNAVAAALWISTSTSTAQLCDFALINPNRDFSFMIDKNPYPTMPVVNVSDLTGSTTSSTLWGSTRTSVVKEVLYGPFQTTGGVTFKHRKEGFTAKPDSTVDYPVITARATDVKFNIMNPQLEDEMVAIQGDWSMFTDTNSEVIQQAVQDYYLITSSLAGNSSLRITYAPNAQGYVMRKLFVGNLTSNTEEFDANNKKNEQTEMSFLFAAANTDYLLQSMGTGITQVAPE